MIGRSWVLIIVIGGSWWVLIIIIGRSWWVLIIVIGDGDKSEQFYGPLDVNFRLANFQSSLALCQQ